MLAKYIFKWLISWLLLLTVSLGGSWLLALQGLGEIGEIVMVVGLVAAYLMFIAGTFAQCQSRWVLWGVVYLGIGVTAGVIGYSFDISNASAAVLASLATGIFLRAICVFRAYEKLPQWRWSAVGLTTTVDIVGLCWRCLAIGYISTGYALGGIWAMALAFLVGLRLIRFMLAPGRPLLGIARTLVDEAVRMRIALVFIVVIMLLVPVMPYLNDPRELLKYRIGAFLSWSMWVTAIALSLMTIFLACGTICSEIRDRQIYLTLSKPVSRWQYLMGKWVGIMLLNMLLLAVAGGGVYTFSRMMQQMRENDPADRRAILDEVLVARVSILPSMPDGMTLKDMIARRFRNIRDQRPDRTPLKWTENQIIEAKTRELNAWHTVGRNGRQTYVFRGLSQAKETANTVQLRLKTAANIRPDSQKVQFNMRVNGKPYPVNELVIDVVHTLPIDTYLIDDRGQLEIVISNDFEGSGGPLGQETDISFTPDEGFQLLYRYGGFGPNLARSMVVLWFQLGFLAIVGLVAGTCLGFPVASLLTLVIYIAAVTSGYLDESISAYAPVYAEDKMLWDQLMGYPKSLWMNIKDMKLWEAAKVLIRLAGELIMALVPSFSYYNPIPLVADGRVVEPSLVGKAALMIGVVWTGVIGFLGQFIFRQRELAGVTV